MDISKQQPWIYLIKNVGLEDANGDVKIITNDP